MNDPHRRPRACAAVFLAAALASTGRFYPVVSVPVDTPAVAADAVRRLGLAPEELRRVLHDNAAALLVL